MLAKCICADAPKWIKTFMIDEFSSCDSFKCESTKMESVFTSLPDAEEIGCSLDDWKIWFRSTLYTILTRLEINGYAIFYQTDRKHKGGLISKSAMVINSAEQLGMRIVFHKIVQTQKGVNLFRPGFTHMICVSKNGTAGKATPDIVDAGKKLYKNATGLNAVLEGLEFLQSKGINKVYDPFCGRGSIGYMAEKLGMESINIDIDLNQVAEAENLIKSLYGANNEAVPGQG